MITISTMKLKIYCWLHHNCVITLSVDLFLKRDRVGQLKVQPNYISLSSELSESRTDFVMMFEEVPQ